MKTIGMLSVAVLVLGGWMTSFSQVIDQPEVPGDHFSLEGALELFKKSESPEEFERLLNSPDSKVNNLDLNGDGYIDYIRVIDRSEGSLHAFILQAVISENESQDVAVIELQKLANGKAILQIIGDEAIYGVETIIEPTREVRTYAGTTSARTVVNVWAWPSVQYVYSPYYDVWVSPWAWHVHPIWWRPWRPVAYVHYYSYWRPYRPYYSVCHTYRVAYAHHRMYRPYRTTSVFVHNRHHDQISRYRSRHDGDRYRNARNDEGRSYSGDDRSPNRDDANRRPADSHDDGKRTYSRDRGITDRQREYTTPRRDDSSDGRPSVTRDLRKVTTPSVNRTRTYESPEIQRRSTTNGRSTMATPQRNPAPVKRYDAPERRPVTVPAAREMRRETNPNVNRTRSFETPSRRSGNVQSAPASRPQPSRSTTVERSRPSTGNMPSRSSNPGSTRTIDTKRGRQ